MGYDDLLPAQRVAAMARWLEALFREKGLRRATGQEAFAYRVELANLVDRGERTLRQWVAGKPEDVPDAFIRLVQALGIAPETFYEFALEHARRFERDTESDAGASREDHLEPGREPASVSSPERGLAELFADGTCRACARLLDAGLADTDVEALCQRWLALDRCMAVDQWTRCARAALESRAGPAAESDWEKLKQVHLALLTRLVAPDWIERSRDVRDPRLIEITVLRFGKTTSRAVEVLVGRFDPDRGIHLDPEGRPERMIDTGTEPFAANPAPTVDVAVNRLGLNLLTWFGDYDPVPEHMAHEHWDYLREQFQFGDAGGRAMPYLVIAPEDDALGSDAGREALLRHLRTMLKLRMSASADSPFIVSYRRIDVFIQAFWSLPRGSTT